MKVEERTRAAVWWLAAVVISAGVGVAASLIANHMQSDGQLYAAACIVLTASVIVAVWLDWRRCGDILSVFALAGVFYLLAFVAGSIFMWSHASFGVKVSLHQPFTHHGLMKAEWLAAASWIALAVGYRLVPGGKIPALKMRIGSERSLTKTLALLYVIGWAARLAGIPRGLYFHGVSGGNAPGAALSTTNQAIHILGVLPMISVAYLGVRSISTGGRLRSWYYIALAVEFGFAIPSGRRVDAVSVLLLALVVAYYGHHRFPVKATAWAAAFAIFFVFPVLHLYRISVNTQQSGYQISNFSNGLNTYTSGGVSGTVLTGVGSTLQRFGDMIMPAALEDRGRTYSPTSEGETIGWMLTNVIPAKLYPGKPNVNQWSNELAYRLGVSPVINNFTAPTIIGELYVDFGNVGAVLAMIVLGMVLRVINDWLGQRQHDNALVIALYAAFAYDLLGAQEETLAVGLVGTLRTMVVAVVLIKGLTWLFAAQVTQQTHATQS